MQERGREESDFTSATRSGYLLRRQWREMNNAVEQTSLYTMLLYGKLVQD